MKKAGLLLFEGKNGERIQKKDDYWKI